ncbi:MFS transporter, partial [Candidatus Bathyarchaeota archaeon]|nr:MFS transporter [Candidatus Bathyarchaeota archaeon]
MPLNAMARPSPPDEPPINDSASSILSSSSHRPPPRTKTAVRTIAFVASILTALCAGSITTFSLYGHIFQERLRYTQLQVNGVAIGSSVAQYLPVPFLGYICDRYGTRPLSVLAAVLFGVGYGLAAGIYRSRDVRNAGLDPEEGDWTYPLMVFSFFCIGVGTCSMYLTAVATCAKNFGKGSNRGLALAAPIASFGLSGMWISQVGSRVFHETRPDGSRGDVDVYRFFVALAILLVVVGALGTATLRVVDEEDLIDEAIEELETSGLLERGSHTSRSRYGTIDGEDEGEALLEPDDARWNKKNLLNAETRRFLS